MASWLWLPLALAAALFAALADLSLKRFFGDLSPYTMALANWSFPLPFLVLPGLFLHWPEMDQTFWLAVGAALPLELLAAFLYMQVLRICHLSLCIPLLAFTPVFLILTGWLVLGEALNPAGLAGLGFVAGGSYLLGLGLGGGRPAWWKPLAALMREPGARLMFGVAGIYSLTSVLGKLAILHSAPAFFGVFYPLAVGGCLAAVYPVSRIRQGQALRSRLAVGLFLGAVVAGEIICQVFGMTLAPAAYIIGVKRLSILFSVMLGGWVLRERPVLPRLAAAGLLVTGVALIALRGA